MRVEYETMLTKALPEELKSSLPTVKEIEMELSRDRELTKAKKKNRPKQ